MRHGSGLVEQVPDTGDGGRGTSRFKYTVVDSSEWGGGEGVLFGERGGTLVGIMIGRKSFAQRLDP